MKGKEITPGRCQAGWESTGSRVCGRSDGEAEDEAGVGEEERRWDSARQMKRSDFTNPPTPRSTGVSRVFHDSCLGFTGFPDRFLLLFLPIDTGQRENPSGASLSFEIGSRVLNTSDQGSNNAFQSVYWGSGHLSTASCAWNDSRWLSVRRHTLVHSRVTPVSLNRVRGI